MERSAALGVFVAGLGVALAIVRPGSGLWPILAGVLLLALGTYLLYAGLSRARRSEWKGSTRRDESGGDFPSYSSGSSSKSSHSRHSDHRNEAGDHDGGDGGGDGGGD
jgi:hypothetical protein